MRISIRTIITIFMVASFFAACGPIKTTIAFQEVENQIEKARRNQADDKVASAYFYYAAKEYLHKAKEEHGYSDFDASEKFAAKAMDLAKKATIKSAKAKKRIKEPKNFDMKKLKKKKAKKKKSRKKR